MQMLERRVGLAAHGTTVGTEALAGLTTFLTMAYIIFVQPAVLSACGMDFGALLVATCLSAAIGTALMAVLANYPIAVAPAMGHNFFFAFSVVVAMKVPWRVALGAVAIAGAIFIVTAGVGLRERLITAIPASIKHAIAAGIGLLVAMIGLQWAGLVVSAPGTLVTLGDLHSPPVLVKMIGGLRHIEWDDPSEGIPAFLALIVMPLAVSITDGIAFGLVAYTVLKLATGRPRQVHPLIYVFAALFLARYVWLR
jgi:AGZA family xanthine/uracil permease-like MFS transporter